MHKSVNLTAIPGTFEGKAKWVYRKMMYKTVQE